MVNYENGKVYVIRSYQTTDVYVGSTCLPLSKRMSKHREHYRAYRKGTKEYITACDILQNDDAYIELLENFPCETREQLRKREGEHIRQMECVNKRIEGRTEAEYREANRERLQAQKKLYRARKKDWFKEMNAKYRAENKESISEGKKRWYEANKEATKAKSRAYYEANKEKIRKRRDEKYSCECGGVYARCHRATHYKTKMHKAFMAEKGTT